MIWAGIIGNELVAPFKVENGVKIDLARYTQFFEKNLMPWMKKKSTAFKKNMVFMLDNAPSHASKFTREWLEKKGIKEDHLMTWPPASPDLNPIENYWSLLKRELYTLCWRETILIKGVSEEKRVQSLTATMDW